MRSGSHELPTTHTPGYQDSRRLTKRSPALAGHRAEEDQPISVVWRCRGHGTIETMRTLIAISCVTLSVSACGSTSDLTCELLADPGNCWAEAAEAAAACLPGTGEVAVLAPDRASCSFGDGTRIVFDEPLASDTMDLERFAFTIQRGGATCARFVDTFANRMELEAGGVSVVSELHPGGAFQLHCPGTTYEAEFSLLFTCQPSYPPTDGFSAEPELVTFSIVSVGTPGELFRCAPDTP
jgi:hypothetical protein